MLKSVCRGDEAGNPSQGFSLVIAVGSGWVRALVPLALAVFCWLLLESSVRIHAVVGIELMLFTF